MGPDFALHPVYGDPDYHQLLNPYAMVIRNGFYFLICNKDNYSDMTHYRIDRITDIQLTDLPVKPCRQLDGFHDGWNLQEYMEHNINMAFGEPSLITFIANEKAVPDIIDAFGKGVSFSRRHDGRYDCSVRVPLYDMERWAMQNLNKVLVTSPPELVQRMEDNLRNGLKISATAGAGACGACVGSGSQWLKTQYQPLHQKIKPCISSDGKAFLLCPVC